MSDSSEPPSHAALSRPSAIASVAPCSTDDSHVDKPAPRARERRRGLGEVLAAVTRSLAQRGDPALARGALEDALRRASGADRIELRPTHARWPRVHDSADASVAFEVPAPAGRAPLTLEARVGPGNALGAWELQLLQSGAHLSALVAELERGSVKPSPPRAEIIPFHRRRDGAAPLIGSTTTMTALRERIACVARTDFTVLIEGESGVGKELVARLVHDLSERRSGPFVALNCAALVETLLEAELFGIEDRIATGVKARRGKFEHADGGTLFLDEVSDLSLTAQAKLLRAIQDLAVERVGGAGARPVNIRIVAATNRGLAGLVERGLFRADLFYRLSGVDLAVPALRERRPDVRELAEYFLDKHRATRRLRLSHAAALALADYHWPGNVRELERLIEHVVALARGDVIELDDLPSRVRGDFEVVLMPSHRRRENLRVWASRYARLALDRCGGNKRRTARELGISYHTLVAYLTLADEGSGPLADASVHNASIPDSRLEEDVKESGADGIERRGEDELVEEDAASG